MLESNRPGFSGGTQLPHQQKSPAFDAQTLLCLEEVMELSAKRLQLYWEIHNKTTADLESSFSKYKELMEQLLAKQKELESREDQIKKEKKDADDAWQEAEKDKDETQKKLEQVRQIEDTNKQTEERLKPLLERESNVKENAKIAKEELEKANLVREAAENERNLAAAKLAKLEELRHNIDTTRSLSWPSFLNDDHLSAWQSSLFSRAQKDANAALLVAAFHKVCAASKLPDSQEVCNALEDLGRRLYADPEVQGLIELISKAFNSNSGGKFTLQCPQEGSAPNSHWMTYNNNVKTIRKVQNWAVLKPGPSGMMQVSSFAVVQ